MDKLLILTFVVLIPGCSFIESSNFARIENFYDDSAFLVQDCSVMSNTFKLGLDLVAIEIADNEYLEVEDTPVLLEEGNYTFYYKERILDKGRNGECIISSSWVDHSPYNAFWFEASVLGSRSYELASAAFGGAYLKAL